MLVWIWIAVTVLAFMTILFGYASLHLIYDFMKNRNKSTGILFIVTSVVSILFLFAIIQLLNA